MADQNVGINLTADASDYMAKMDAAGRATTAFGQANTKAGRAAAAAMKEAKAAAADVAEAERQASKAADALATALGKQGKAAADANTNAAKLAETNANLERTERRLAVARANNQLDKVETLEARLNTLRAQAASRTRLLNEAEQTRVRLDREVAAAGTRRVAVEQALAAAQQRSVLAIRELNTATGALGAARLGSIATLTRDFGNLVTSSEAVRTKFSQLATVTGGALAAGFGFSVFAAAKFERALLNVATINDTVAEHMDVFRSQILDLSRELPQTAQELAEGFYDIASSGFSATDAMTVLRASAEAASAGLTSTAVSARAIAAVLKAYGLEAAAASDVSDIMFQTVNKGVITFEELSMQVGDFVGTAAAAGVKFDDVSAGLAAITLSGVPAAQAATALNNTMNKILKPSESMADALNQIGYRSGAAALRTLGLKGTLDKLAESQGTAADTASRLFPDLEAMRGYLTLTANAGRNYADTFHAIADEVQRAEATHKALQEQQKGAAYQAQIARNSFAALAVELGTALLPVVKAVTSVLNGLGDFLEDIPGPIRTIIGVLGGLSGVILLLSAGFVRGKLALADFQKQMIAAGVQGSVLSKTLTASAVALGAISGVLAVVSIGYAMYAATQAKVKAATDELTTAIEAQNAGLQNAVRQSIIQQLVDEGDISRLEGAGVSLERFSQAVTGTQEQYDALVKHLYGRQGIFEPFWTDAKRSLGALELQRKAFLQAQKAAEDQRKAQLQSAADAMKAGNAHDALTATLKLNQQGNIELSKSQEDLSKSLVSFVDIAKAAGEVFKPVDYSAFADVAKSAGADLGKLNAQMVKSTKATADWHKNLAQVARKAGPDLAAQLEKLGPQYAKLTAKIARAGAPEIAKIKKNFASLAPSAKQSFAQFTEVLAEQITAQRGYLTNLARLSTMGYSDIAEAISKIADPQQAAMAARSAVNASTKELERFRKVYSQSIMDPNIAATFEAQFRVLSQIAARTTKVTMGDVADLFALPRDQLDLTRVQLEQLRAHITDEKIKAVVQVLLDTGEISPEALADLRNYLGREVPAEHPVKIALDNAEAINHAEDLKNQLKGLTGQDWTTTVLERGIEPSTAAAKLLKTAYDSLPPDIQTQVMAPGAVDATTMLRTLDDAIQRFRDRQVSVTVDTNMGQGWGSLGEDARREFHGVTNAQGNVLLYGDGTENHVAQIAPPGAWRLWAEPETGGEAYIPLADHKRDRSTDILADVADRFGYSLIPYAGGGVTHDLNVNTSAPGGTDAINAAVRGLSAYNAYANNLDAVLTSRLDALLTRNSWTKPISDYHTTATWMSYPGHTGIDLAGPWGTPVQAAATGTVAAVRHMNTSYGNHIRIRHPDGTVTLYGHMQDTVVGAGQPVSAGQTIGHRGSTGNSTGPHLHFETRPGDSPVDPRPFMAARGVNLASGGISRRRGIGGPAVKPPARDPMLNPGAALDYATDDNNRFSLSKFKTGLRTAVRETQRWRDDLTRVARRAGEDVAQALADMGEQGVALTHKMATGTRAEVDSIAAQLRRLAPEAGASLARFNTTLQQENQRTAAFERNLTTLVARGYGELAKRLAEAGDANAMNQARQAVRNNRAARTGNANVIAHNQLLGEDLADVLTVMDAIRGSRGGIHEVAGATGLGEDRIIEVANRGRSRLGALGGSARRFLSDLARANKQLSYAEGGLHVAQIANAPRIWAEPETGGEAYIPLAAAKRERSTRILGEVAKRFGYGLAMASGGIVRGRVHDAVSGRAQVIVVEKGDSQAPLIGSLSMALHNGNATPRAAAEEVLYQIRRARRGRS